MITPIDELFAKESEGYSDLLDFVTNIPLVNWMIDPNRPRVKDLPKDNKGRAIVNIHKPHILENMSYFTVAADTFRKEGKYCQFYPSKAPNSPYRKFWDEEIRRCKEGYVREDGEWVTGYYYYYLNYCPIWKTVTVGERTTSGLIQSSRIEGFPDIWDGDYLFFHYCDQAIKRGEYGTVLKARGKGYSFKAGNMLQCNYFLYPGSKSYALAADSEYLDTDGILNKADDNFSFVNEFAGFGKKLALKDTLMHRKAGYKKPGDVTEYGTKSERIGVTLKNKPDKARGKRGQLIVWEEAGSFPHLLKSWELADSSLSDGARVFGFMLAFGCVCAGTKVWTAKGELVNIEDLNQEQGILGYDGVTTSTEDITYMQEPAKKLCYKITTNTGRTLECSEDHPILWSTQHLHHSPRLTGANGKKLNKRLLSKKTVFKQTKDIKVGEQIAVIDEVPFFSDKEMTAPRVVGWLIGDGTYGIDHSPRLSNCEIEINNYIESTFEHNITKTHITKDNKVYKETVIKNFCPVLRELGIYGQTKSRKTLPVNIHSYSKHSICELIGGLFDTDGYVAFNEKTKTIKISITAAHKSILLELQLLLQKLGIHGATHEIKADLSNPKNKNNYFRLEIGDKRSLLNFYKNITLYPKVKQDRLNLVPTLYIDRKERTSTTVKGIKFERVASVENIGIKDIYNLTANTTHTYIANGIVTHNTGGEEGVSFEGLSQLFYGPKAYKIYGVKNVFDKNSDKNYCSFFVPDYLNRADCYDKDGNSDVTKALAEIIARRIEIKYSSNDSSHLTQHKAEHPVTPQEAMMRTQGSEFPVLELTDHLSRISPSKEQFVANHYIIDITWRGHNLIDWKPVFDKQPIRSYPYKGRDILGAIEVYELPKTTQGGKIPWGRYIIGVDPVDDDTNLTQGISLFNVWVFDLWDDVFVAEYTGRYPKASDNYDIAAKLAVMYNAEVNYENKLKGMFDFFNKRNMLNYLMDTPNLLRDMEYVKDKNTFGNKAHPYSQVVYTPQGKKLWGDVQVGDKLFDSTGGICTVTNIPYDDVTDIYRLELRDGRQVYATGNHLWSVIKNNSNKEIILPSNELKNNLIRKDKLEFNYYISKNLGVNYKDKSTLLDPYTLGLLLGDGSFSGVKGNTIHFASGLKDLETYKKLCPYQFTVPSDDRHMYIIIPNMKNISVSLGLYGKLSHEKFIPDEYKYNSKSVRLSVLKGLMDTDGSVDTVGIPTYSSTSEQLIEDIQWLCRSLGYNCNCTKRASFYTYKGVKKQGKDSYKLSIFTTDPIFGLDRKNVKISKSDTGRSKSKREKTAIKSITFSHVERAKCVTVDSKDSCYLIGEFVKTHNSKGTPPNEQINAFARRQQAEWMLTPVASREKTSYDDTGNLQKEVTLGYQTLRSFGYIQECISWNKDGNFDRVSGANMVFIARADRYKITQSSTKVETEADPYADDPFFKNNPGVNNPYMNTFGF